MLQFYTLCHGGVGFHLQGFSWFLARENKEGVLGRTCTKNVFLVYLIFSTDSLDFYSSDCENTLSSVSLLWFQSLSCVFRYLLIYTAFTSTEKSINVCFWKGEGSSPLV